MRTAKEMKRLEEMAQHIRRGGSWAAFKPADVHALQTYALDVRDLKLYDFLETFWAGMKKFGGEVR